MEHNEQEKNQSSALVDETMKIENSYRWKIFFAALAVDFFVEIPNFIKGFIEGWNAYNR